MKCKLLREETDEPGRHRTIQDDMGGAKKKQIQSNSIEMAVLRRA